MGTSGGGGFGAGTDASLERGVLVIAVFILLVYAIFVGRFFELQITEGADLRARSERNSVRNIILEAPRGDIVDREGRVLATTRPAFGLQVMPVDLCRLRSGNHACPRARPGGQRGSQARVRRQRL